MAHSTPNTPSAIYWFARGFLGLGVPLFFMISAFALASRYTEGIATPRALARYATRRVMRLYPLYLAMMAVFLYPYDSIPSAEHFALYASLLFALVPPLAHGFVWASWSISVEVLFYCIFPLILRASPSTLLLLLAVVAGHIVSLLLAPFMSPAFTGAPWYWAVGWHQYIPFFALGLVAYRLQAPVLARGRRSTFELVAIMVGSVALAVVILTFLGSPFDEHGRAITSRYVHLLVASTLPTFCLMLWLVTDPPLAVVNRITLYLGKISYSIFLLHPLLVFKLTPAYLAIQRLFGEGVSAFFLSAALTAAALLPMAALSYRWIEAPAIRLAARLTRTKRGGPGQSWQ